MKTKLLFFLLPSFLLLCNSAAGNDALLCLKETAKQEKEDKIQTNLLSAIALVESGRYSKDYPSGIAWPWTVTAEGKGNFYPSKKEAVKAVLELQKKALRTLTSGACKSI